MGEDYGEMGRLSSIEYVHKRTIINNKNNEIGRHCSSEFRISIGIKRENHKTQDIVFFFRSGHN